MAEKEAMRGTYRIEKGLDNLLARGREGGCVQVLEAHSQLADCVANLLCDVWLVCHTVKQHLLDAR
jgi:hypothetical protein